MGQIVAIISIVRPIDKSRVKTSDGEIKWTMRPVVHNLIFIRKVFSEEVIRKILSECPYPLSVYRHQDKAQSWCEIAGQNIIDLRIMCDAAFCEPTFITQKEYDMKVGHIVRVVHGPLSGIRGKLVRKNKKYYIMKSFDMNCPDGDHIKIELRDPDEIKIMWYERPMAPADVKCYNPSFDVTDHELLAGIVTEKGIVYPPFDINLKKLFDEDI